MPQVFGYPKRPAVKQRKADSTTVGPHTSMLGGQMESARKSGGGIQAGAHPEFDTETPLDKVVKFGRGVIKKIRGK